jgi:hypothetical protein
MLVYGGIAVPGMQCHLVPSSGVTVRHAGVTGVFNSERQLKQLLFIIGFGDCAR